jgi:CDP-4-dehydro-6-deoxyglucose reductase
MSQLLTLSRAARLAGVTRGDLQLKIRSGALETFEGKVRLSDLLRVYPQVRMDSSPILERVESIKAAAVPRQREEERGLPAAEVVFQRLESLAQVLVETKAGLNRASEILAAVAQRLQALADGPSADVASGAHELAGWLAGEMSREAVQPDPRARLFAKDYFLRLIAASVKVIPSGHEFLVEGTDSILDAAIRSGLSLGYGCASGNCGSCKARVVSGEVFKLRDHDYVLSDRERQLGYMLMCSNTAVTDLVLEADEAVRPSDLPSQKLRATVHRLVRVGPDLALLQVQTPRTQTLRFFAGQRATLTLADDVSATYPIASCPCDGRRLEFHVRRRPGDPFTDRVFEGLRPQATVTITGPQGAFVLQDDSPRRAVLVALDDGFAPIKSLTEHAVSIDTVGSLAVYWVVSRPDGLYLDNLCRSWRDSLENFQYVPLRAEPAGTEEGTLGALRSIVESEAAVETSNFYVAGTEAFVSAAAELLKAHGLPPDQLRTEVVPAPSEA